MLDSGATLSRMEPGVQLGRMRPPSQVSLLPVSTFLRSRRLFHEPKIYRYGWNGEARPLAWTAGWSRFAVCGHLAESNTVGRPRQLCNRRGHLLLTDYPYTSSMPWAASGNERMRFPVSFASAFTIAGAMGGVEGSPMPP